MADMLDIVPLITLRYSPNSGVEIEGTREGLLSVADQIRLLAQTGVGEIAFPADSTESPAPFDRCLEKLIISVGAGALLISIEGNRELKMVGNAKSLGSLASYFVFESYSSPSHNHLEYLPGDDWISEASEPVVVAWRC